TLPKHVIKQLCNPRVIAFFGNFILRDFDLNFKSFDGRHHWHRLNKHVSIGKSKIYKKEVSSSSKSKVACVPWTKKRNILGKASLKNISIDYHLERPIDVCFIGATSIEKNNDEQNKDPYTIHRKLALHELKKINHRNTFLSEQFIPYEKYLEILRSSKIVVSPWGRGEWCWRDFEAVLCGAVLIKPDTSFVKMIPDLYQNNVYYVPCKPDFSDLQETVNKVLNDYSSFEPMRKNAYNLLANYTDEEMFATFMDNLRKALNQNS
ncbi:MAG: hypothetical protein ABUT20_43955, partial [Bacteroidota bacterium]